MDSTFISSMTWLFDSDGADAAFSAFQDALLERFTESPEGQERPQGRSGFGLLGSPVVVLRLSVRGSVISQMTVATCGRSSRTFSLQDFSALSGGGG